MAAKGDGESDWIFDYVMSIFKSPAWEVPVMTFIDENCIVFDSEEENKFAYTEIHTQFCELVDNLLGSHLAEIGVSAEDFVEACEAARYRRDVNSMVIDQIMSVDDYLTFKKMMVKRNMELELEAVRALRDNDLSQDFSRDQQENEAAFLQALRETAAGIPKSQLQELDDDEEIEITGELSSDALVDARARVQMDQKLMELELLHKREEMEQLELEQAIAMSLALEEERLRLAKTEAKKTGERGHSDPTVVAAASTSLSSVEKSADVTSRPTSSQSKADSKGSSGGGSAPQEKKASAAPAAAKPVAPAPVQSKSVPMPVQEALPEVKPMPAAGSKLVPLADLQQQMVERKAAAEEAFRRNQEALRQQKVTQETLRNQARISEAEMERRAAHLREQRDRILAGKKAEREQKLREFEANKERQRKEEEERVARAREEAELRSAAAAAAAGASGAAAVDEAEERRAALRQALARRMKQDLLESEEDKLAKMQANQFTDLDRKLREVESLREENRLREEEMFRQVKKAQDKRQANLQKSLMRMQNTDDFVFGEM